MTRTQTKLTSEDRGRQAELAAELRRRTDEICSRLRWNTGAATDIGLLEELATERAPEVMLHGERVARYAQAVAREWRLDADAARLLRTAARFHDIGTVAMPASLITKPAPLTPGEWAVLHRHAEVGAEILSASRQLSELAPIVAATHEWFDGHGYPRQLAGAAIPLASRIIAVADVYDSSTQQRYGRVRIDSAAALTELLHGRGTQFDPDVLDTFLALIGTH
jgi:putative nucleotidyltransferase with HDIG domain